MVEYEGKVKGHAHLRRRRTGACLYEYIRHLAASGRLHALVPYLTGQRYFSGHRRSLLSHAGAARLPLVYDALRGEA
jgi:hypothetical protein